jgi:hypothetical protein
MKIKELPKKYNKIWEKTLPILRKGRPGDDVHSREAVQLVLNYKGNVEFDPDVVIPVAMMHDIGHVAILSEHFKYVTGPEKITNAKLVHMLAGAKIAKDILDSVGYDKKKTAEIVDIIRMHDYDQLKGVDWRKEYDTVNKKFFHDMDALDRYTEERINNMSFVYKDRKVLLDLLEKMIGNLFYDEFRKIAEGGMKKLKEGK